MVNNSQTSAMDPQKSALHDQASPLDPRSSGARRPERGLGPALGRWTRSLPALDVWNLWEAPPALLGPVVGAFSDPGSGVLHVGFGSAARLEGPLSALASSYSRFTEQWVDERPDLPRAFASFAFDGPWPGWAPGSIEHPRWMLSLGPQQSTLSLLRATSALRGEREPPAELSEAAELLLRASAVARRPAQTVHAELRQLEDDAAFRQRVNNAKAAIATQRLRKVVLARQSLVLPSAPPSLRATLETLHRLEPRAHVFAVAGPAGAWFLGASPELLAEVSPGRLRTVALAGTRRRGRDEAEDRALSEELRTAPKDRLEQAFVLERIEACLAGIAERVRPGPLEVRQAATVQHLETRVEADLRPGVTLLDAVLALHPTPAVLGTPSEAARSYLAAEEPWIRGAYAGPVGVLDGQGGGRMAVALRAGLLEPGRVVAFAGAGIVERSDAELEQREIAQKLGAFTRGLSSTEEPR